jgi:hypothetical protein
VDSNFQFRARNTALQRRPSSRSRGGWRGSAANSAPVSFLAEQVGGRRGFSASWQFATRYDQVDPWNKGHLIGQTHLFKPKDVRTIRARPELEALPRHPRLNVIAARLDRPLPGLQLRMEHVPDMNHFGPDLQIDADIGGARGFGQRDRVVEQSLLKAWKPRVDVIVPVPPSKQRALPPVLVLAAAIGKRIGIPVADCLKRKEEIPALKDVSDHDQRLKLLDGLHGVDKSATRGKRILLFDDLYRSGTTMNAITADLYQKGMTKDVFAMTITRTRSNE